MFKGILPLRRIVSGDFQMLTTPSDGGPNGKENYPSNPFHTEIRPRSDKPKKRTKSNMPDMSGFNETDPFDKLLVSSMRPKHACCYAMEFTCRLPCRKKVVMAHHCQII